MERREIDFISKQLWKDELAYRDNPKNAHDVKLEQELFREVNTLGYDFFWSLQFNRSKFSVKDKAIISIIVKYVDRFESSDLANHYLCCLGVKGFYDATEFLINKYKQCVPPSYNAYVLNAVSQTIANIRDSRYIDVYLDFLKDDVVVSETWFIVQMLGRMKIERAIPHFIRLLDGERLIRESRRGTVLEDSKFLVSQTSIEALSQFKNPDYIKFIEKFLEPEKIPWIKFEESKEARANLRATYATYKNITKKAMGRMLSH